MQTQMEDIQISEAILDAVRRYDAAMSLAVPESEHADVNKYLVYPLRNYLRSSGKRLRPHGIMHRADGSNCRGGQT